MDCANNDGEICGGFSGLCCLYLNSATVLSENKVPYSMLLHRPVGDATCRPLATFYHGE